MAPEQKRLPKLSAWSSEPYCFWCECKEKENQKLRDKIKKMTCSYFEHINSLQRKIIGIEKWYADNSTAPENVVAWRELADILRK